MSDGRPGRLFAHPYRGCWAAIATMHGKERAIAPVLCRWFEMAVSTAPGIDTDELGTFTGEVARQGTMLDAARAKAERAIARTGAAIGIGSEGAFGPDQALPLIASGRELLLLREAASGHEVVVSRRTRTNFDHVTVAAGDPIDDFLQRVGFPDHAVIVRAEPRDGRPAVKGLRSRKQVDAALRAVFATGSNAMLETDMRAHLNPTRMASIACLTRALAVRSARRCPSCGAPGFGIMDVERGLPCRQCGAPTQRVRAEVHGCSACNARVQRHARSPTVTADPMWCDICNP
ncbi:hypothetical protein ES707_06579 [subsurface metagenome]|jgi:hypothetical protein